MTLRRNRDFVLLWSANLAATLGTQVASVAYPLLALDLTHSATRAGMLGSTGMLAAIALRLPAGALVDRWSRRHTMLVCELLRAVLLTVTVAGLALGLLGFWTLLCMTVTSAACGVFFHPAQTAVLRQVVPAEHLPRALAQNEARDHAASIAGPSLGGLLFGLGRAIPLAGELMTCLFSFAAIFAIRTPMPRSGGAGTRRHLLADIGEGLRWTWRQRFLRLLMITAAGFGLVFSALNLTAVVAAGTTGAGPAGTGLMMGMAGVGGLLGAVAAPRLQRSGPTAIVLAMFWVAAASIAAMAVHPTVSVIGPLLAVALFLTPAANSILYSYQIALTPDHLQGRVISGLALVGGAAAPLAPVTVGLILDRWGVTAALLLIASTMAAVAAGATMSRTIRNLPPLTAVAYAD